MPRLQIHFLKLLVCCSLVFSFVHFVPAQHNSEAAVTLEIGKQFERDFAVTNHLFEIKLAAGDYIDVLIEQNGVDVTANLHAGGQTLMSFDADMRPRGSEKIEFVAPVAANYYLLVAPKYKNIFAGKYLITLNIARPASEAERAAQEIRDGVSDSVRLSQTRKYDEAVAAVHRARAALEKSDAANDFLRALILRRTGIILFDKGDYPAAELNLTQAARILERIFEAGDPRVSEALNNLAVLYNVIGKYAQAELLFRRNLANQEKFFGENHPLVASTLNNLGNLYRRTGDYLKAEATHLRSLAIREKIYGLDQPETGTALSGLSTVYYEKKDFEKAKLIDERALRIGEKNLAPDDPRLRLYLSNVALAYTELGEYARAEIMLLRSLAIGEKAFGADNINNASELNNLGKLYAHQGDYAKSNLSYQRSLQLSEKFLPEHYLTAHTLGNVAANYLFQGDYQRAKPLLHKQLAMREKVLGGAHPDVAKSLNNLARIYEAETDAARAAEFQTRANDLIERHINLNSYAGSEIQQLAFFDYLSEQTDQILSMQNRFADNQTIRQLGAMTVLQRKGRVQDILADNLSALRRRFSAKDQKLLTDLSDANSQLAELTTGGAAGKITVSERAEKIKSLIERKENLEAEISRLSAGFYQTGTSPTLENLRTEIPSDAVLLEFAVYRPFKMRAVQPSEQYGKARYAVYVIRSSGAIEFRDLGEAELIDAKIRSLREALRDPQRKDVFALSRAADERILQPIRQLFGDATRLLIAPDGALNLIPFEALIDEKGKYLVENYAVNYLTIGRDLLRMKAAPESKSPFLLIANPQFGETLAAQNAPRNFSETIFAPLGGTAREASAIKTLFPDATSLTAAQATETALKAANAPRLLHIATHGFFLENNQPNAADSSATRGAAIEARARNPLLRSGLALAGANRRGEKSVDDGILTALEASNLNLWGTKLVVLSACDTGLGEVKNGEGVYGLRRAFTLAGTQSLVMSLWSVSDAVTREMMIDYYKNLKQGTGRGASLRQVQLAMLKRRGRTHPFYWASFIQSGEWANLDGKR